VEIRLPCLAMTTGASSRRLLLRLLACVIAQALWLGPQVVSAHAAQPSPAVTVVQTDGDLSQRMATMPAESFTSRPPSHVPVIEVDARKRYQTIKGVGGAMTDSSAWLIGEKLGSGARSALLRNLFGANAAGLNFVRLPMGASDFTATGKPYSYDDLPAGQSDPQLLHFSIAHDEAYIIPTMRQVMRINPAANTLAEPWSPPPWMKANDRFDDLGFSGTLLPADYPVLANYFVKFLEAYAIQGVPIQAVTPENEPRAPASYPSMSFPESAEVKWATQDLLPALQAAKLPTRVYGGDVSFSAPSYGIEVASGAAKAGLYGVAQHCYHGIPYLLNKLHSTDAALDLLVSECAVELTPYSASEIVIGAMRNWASAVALWNLALDPQGGPVQPPNSGCHPCRGIVTINPRTHAVTYNLAYYQLAQFGRFVKPGAERIDTNHLVSYFIAKQSGRYGATQGVDDVAFRNPDGSLALFAYNNSGKSSRFAVSWAGHSFSYELPAHATVTFVWNRPS
jgi:glucosylceramidase